jgi:hypothetical protein
MNVILHYAPPVINITVSNLARTSIFKRFLCKIRNQKEIGAIEYWIKIQKKGIAFLYRTGIKGVCFFFEDIYY